MKQIPNSFTTYELSERDQIQGEQLTTLNVAVLQNLLSQIVEEKLNLVFTPADTQSFLQQESYLKGQMDMIRYILAAHESSTINHVITTKGN